MSTVEFLLQFRCSSLFLVANATWLLLITRSSFGFVLAPSRACFGSVLVWSLVSVRLTDTIVSTRIPNNFVLRSFNWYRCLVEDRCLNKSRGCTSSSKLRTLPQMEATKCSRASWNSNRGLLLQGKLNRLCYEMPPTHPDTHVLRALL